MREIKFRAWDKSSKVIREVSNINWFDELVYLDEKTSGEGVRRSLDDVDLMQFTGLLDKNGIEIYEGDILRCSRDYWDKTRNLVVEWHTDCWSLLNTDDPVGSEVMNHNSSFNVPEYEREVIGNIYENPELLEDKS